MYIDYIEILNKYYKNNQKALEILLIHSRAVRDKALEIIRKNKELKIELQKIIIGAMLHDIGIIFCKAPKIFCFGNEPYIRHGILGGEILRKEKLENYIGICENHIGVGITKKDIIKNNLPLPEKDYTPKTIEEEIICLADKFFSKSKLGYIKSINEIREELSKFGEEKLKTFNKLCKKYNLI